MIRDEKVIEINQSKILIKSNIIKDKKILL